MFVAVLGFTLFLSAFLLFWIQPMVAKMALPFLGGSASVWTTCVLFFQTALLGGYIYAHALSRYLRLRAQIVVHAVLLTTAFWFLPIRFAEGGGVIVDEPAGWLLLRLAATAGLPFFAVSATAPLLQNWLARTTAESRRDPYFLYAASNAGSLLSLAVYPLMVEPRLGVGAQSRFWMSGYIALIAMIVVSALLTLKRRDPKLDRPAAELSREESSGSVSLRDRVWPRFYWMAAAFVPSALMLAVTSRISIDLASVPFLWIVPLAIYLLTFILAFAGNLDSAKRSAVRLAWALPPVLLILLPLLPPAAPARGLYNWLLTVGHLTLLFAGAYLCHTSLSARRPEARQLTEYYFWIALGGALGGVFAAVIAPQLFRTVMEYPILVGLLPFFRILGGTEERWGWKDWALPAAMSVSLFFGSLFIQFFPWPLIVLVAATFLMRERSLRFSLSFIVLLTASVWIVPRVAETTSVIEEFRNFFGAKRVTYDAKGQIRRLMHGDTIHGYESQEAGLIGKPLSYYHPTGPVGDVMRVIESRPPQHVGVVGLGTGSMAAYAGPNRRVTFFDVDPQMVGIARGYFTFLDRCGSQCNIVLGDGRISLNQVPDGEFDVLMLDAFSSDSVPPHLVSREALQVYLGKLKPNGLVLFHVSSRYLNLAKLVASVVTDAGLPAYIRDDSNDESLHKLASIFVAVGRDEAAFASAGFAVDAHPSVGAELAYAPRIPVSPVSIPSMSGWRPLPKETELRPWTDDYSNMLALIAPIDWGTEMDSMLPGFVTNSEWWKKVRNP